MNFYKIKMQPTEVLTLVGMVFKKVHLSLLLSPVDSVVGHDAVAGGTLTAHRVWVSALVDSQLSFFIASTLPLLKWTTDIHWHSQTFTPSIVCPKRHSGFLTPNLDLLLHAYSKKYGNRTNPVYTPDWACMEAGTRASDIRLQGAVPWSRQIDCTAPQASLELWAS